MFNHLVVQCSTLFITYNYVTGYRHLKRLYKDIVNINNKNLQTQKISQ